MNVAIALWVSEMYSGVPSSCQMFDRFNAFPFLFIEERVNLLNQTDFLFSSFPLNH